MVKKIKKLIIIYIIIINIIYLMTYNSINEYITYLIDNQVNVNIIDFVKEINKIKYNIDISFIDEFIELVSKDNCIHHNLLKKYSISNLKGGSSDIKKINL
jgi:hypothetical protein